MSIFFLKRYSKQLFFLQNQLLTFIVKQTVKRPAPFLNLVRGWSSEDGRAVTITSNGRIGIPASQKLEFLFHILSSEKSKKRRTLEFKIMKYWKSETTNHESFKKSIEKKCQKYTFCEGAFL